MAVAGRLLIETSGVDGYLLEDGSGVLTIDNGLAFVSAVELLRTGLGDPVTWNHTIPAEARGFAVFIGNVTSATDHIVSVTVGGVALRRVVRATDTLGAEPGSGDWWILESGVPTGVQVVSVDLSSATADDMYFLSLAFIGERDIEVVDSDSVSEDAADPQVTLQYGGRTAIGLVGIYSGHGLQTDLEDRPNQWRTDVDWSMATNRGCVVSQAPLRAADTQLGYFSVSGFADDCALVALAIAETIAAAATENRALHRLHAVESYPSGLTRF